MSGKQYKRDNRTGSLILSDQYALEQFSKMKQTKDQMECLKNEIDTLKEQLQTLHTLLIQNKSN
jgi:hypothetical protein